MDPITVQSRSELVGLLDAMRRHAGWTYGKIDKERRRLGPAAVLPRATVNDMCTGVVLPSEETLREFLRMCRVPAAEVHAWLAARERVSRSEPPARRRPTGDPRDNGPLRTYLTAVRQAATIHPYPLRLPTEPSMNDVYVTRILTSGPRRVDLAAVLGGGGHTLVTAVPGAGKSTLVRHHAGHTASCWLEGERMPFIPVLISAAGLPPDVPFATAVATAVQRDLGHLLDHDLPADIFADQPVPGLPWLIIVDGLDELVDQRDRDRITQTLVSRRDDDRYRFLVTSRPLPDVARLEHAGFTSYVVEPLTDTQIRELATRWFVALQLTDVNASTDGFLRAVRNADLTDTVRAPLFTVMACAVYAGGPGDRLPVDRADLYERFLATLSDKQYRDRDAYRRLTEIIGRYPAGERAAAALAEQSRSLVERVAWHHCTVDQESVLSLIARWTADLRPPTLPAHGWIGYLREHLRQLGPLVGNGDDFTFAHRTIQDYLASCHVAAQPLEEAVRLLHDAGVSNWANAFQVLLAMTWRARRPDLDDLLDALLDRDEEAGRKLVRRLVRCDLPVAAAVRRRAADSYDRVIDDWHRSDLTRFEATTDVLQIDPDRGAARLEALATSIAEDITVIEASVDLLRRHRPDRTRPVLLAIAADGALGAPVRINAATELLDLDPDAAVEAIRGIVRDPRVEGYFRLRTVDRLARGRRAEGRPLLAELAGSETLDEPYRAMAIAALRATSTPDLDPRPGPQLTAATWDAVLAGAQNLGQMKGPPDQVLPMLAALAANPMVHPQHRVWAAATLVPHDRQHAASLLDGFVGDMDFRISYQKHAYWYFLSAAVLTCVDRHRGAAALARLAGGAELAAEPEDDDQRLAHRLLRLLNAST